MRLYRFSLFIVVATLLLNARGYSQKSDSSLVSAEMLDQDIIKLFDTLQLQSGVYLL